MDIKHMFLNYECLLYVVGQCNIKSTYNLSMTCKYCHEMFEGSYQHYLIKSFQYDDLNYRECK